MVWSLGIGGRGDTLRDRKRNSISESTVPGQNTASQTPPGQCYLSPIDRVPAELDG
jgi:hypothetical protein